MPENTTRVRRDVGRYVNDALRDRYFAACEAVYALGAPARSETDVETGFGTTHVYRYGPTDPAAETRTPVVLIHGAGGCSAQWYPNTRALGAERPVYALDTPGDPGRSVHREPMWQPERAAQWMDEALDALGLDRVHLVGSSYGGWLVINQAHLRPGRLASVTALDPGGLEKVGLRFFAWVFASLFATFAPKALRPRLAAWLEQPVLIVPELRAMVRTGVRAFRIRRPAPLPLSDEQLGSIRTPFNLIMGKRSLLVHPQRQLERVPRLIPGARADIIAATGHGPQLDFPDLVNAQMLSFMEDVDALGLGLDPSASRGGGPAVG
ncbi:alpha/beta fold hydrolase [Streptomyces sp. NBC_01591]|uniref:alpha/beta fold hydrolase n=1 Tax=Streptomyces sp. NBC_01591 TaxID=2975888 RepID=UPI002DDA171F|nr:alpha/beta fold hydrolase [Streptomyces sp. NBC_01591]WSD69399.1 alpha/beta fold hydrolase [Streptomyces sp. NBC_01591]